jgi:hypothetical protein
MSAAADHAAAARASLVKSLNYLEIGLAAARKGRMPEADAFEQAIWTQTNLLHAWPAPDRVAS